MHFCEEVPCPVEEREYVKLLEGSFDTYYTNIKSTNLIDMSHTCTCRDYHWQEDTPCVVHPKN